MQICTAETGGNDLRATREASRSLGDRAQIPESSRNRTGSHSSPARRVRRGGGGAALEPPDRGHRRKPYWLADRTRTRLGPVRRFLDASASDASALPAGRYRRVNRFAARRHTPSVFRRPMTLRAPPRDRPSRSQRGRGGGRPTPSARSGPDGTRKRRRGLAPGRQMPSTAAPP